MNKLYMVGGANGSGKTTVAKEILTSFLNVYEYVNADEIARGLSPFCPENVSVQAGKLMIKRLHYLCEHNIGFALESTLSGSNYVKFIKKCRLNNYQIHLIYFWLESPQIVIQRVKKSI
ncbi:MAG: zeta toxin family protein [Cyanobacterium sp. T60_A2020_053]|nr:zeta toxin family protein [Cyanobacterium sp. T60_A2020_053]